MAAAAEENEKGGAGGATRSLRRLLLLSARRGPDRPLLVSTPPSSGREGGSGSGSAALFRGLGCASASAALAYAPAPQPSSAAAVVRASADWQARRSRGRRKNGKVPRKKDRDRVQHCAPPLPPRPLHSRRTAVASDLWCATGISFAAAADDSVDCVVPSHQRHWLPSEGRGGRVADGERALQRERPCIARRDGGRNLEQLSSLLDSNPEPLEVPPVDSDLMLPAHRHHLRRFHGSRGGLQEIMMLQSGLLLGGMDVYDQYRDWRLDVDNMSYEELLELGDKIGHVNTGLREEEIFQCLTKKKHSIFVDPLIEFSTQMERICSICQEEYTTDDEVGKLECGHCYHIHCIRQWLLQKNVCPVCKIAAGRS